MLPAFSLAMIKTALMITLSVSLLTGAGSPGNNAELISIGIDGQAGNASSEIRAGSVSADGRYVVFSSLADNLTADDVSGWQVYLRDRENGTTTLVSDTGTDTVYGSTTEGHAVISADGRFIAFASTNGSLVADDTNGSADIFVYDRSNQSIRRVSVASDGSQAAACSCSWPDTCNGCEYHWLNSHPSISADGRFIAFTSFSYNFVGGDVPDTPDVFIHDQQTGTTTIVSHASDGNLGNADSSEPCISNDGNFIAFSSKASNLIAEDWNNQQDVFLWQRDSSNLSRVSVATDGTEGNLTSTDPVISEDGALIAFTSGASNLVSADANGPVYDIFLRNMSQGTTSILSSGLASGGARPSISSNGVYVAFTSGSDDIHLANVSNEQRQLIDDYMQFSALNHTGTALVMSGYASLSPLDNNNDKDVYLVSIDVSVPPTDPELCDDGIDNDSDGLVDCDDWTDCSLEAVCADQQPPPDDDGDNPAPEDSTENTSNGDDSGGSCAYNPGGRFDLVLPGLIVAGLIYLGRRIKRERSSETRNTRH
jgi:Tol biopolymer transport system component